MQAEIETATDDGFEVVVTDNSGVDHELKVCDDGEITTHLQDGYPDDPANRSMIDEIEPLNQAKRYAKHYVNRERGYDTVDWRRDPDRIAAVALIIAGVDDQTITKWFGELYDQVRSHFNDINRPVSLPDEIRPGHLIYQQDIYLASDHQEPTAFNGLAADLNPTVLTASTTASPKDVTMVLRKAVQRDETGPDVSTLRVDTVSGIHLRWDDTSGTYHHSRQEPAIDRDPDARLDIPPFDPGSIVSFQSQLIQNLVCQARDCYIEMGITPPKPFRVQGIGKHKTSTWYEHYDFYQRYHDPAADIDWETVEPGEDRLLIV